MRRFAKVAAAAGGAAVCYHASNAHGQRRDEILRTVQRSTRTAAVVLNLGVRYKALLWHRDREDSTLHEVRKTATHQHCAAVVLDMCRANGGLFIKTGQHAATLKRVLPEEYLEALAVLQDRAPARCLSEVQEVVRREFCISAECAFTGPGSPFLEFDEVPVGSASLAQVHRAVLHDGSEVAVKVQHADIEFTVASDLLLMRWADWFASVAFSDEDFSLNWVIDEFEANVAKELDFTEEARNAESLRTLFMTRPDVANRVIIPKMHKIFTTERVLTMDFIHGIPIHRLTARSDLDLNSDMPFIRKEIANSLLESMSAMVFIFGLIHCDLHPGNMLVVLPEGKSSNEIPRLALLDHGLYRRLSEEMRLANCKLWKSMALQDADGVVSSCASMGVNEATARVLPIYFTNRSNRTQAALGEPVSAEERAAMRQELINAGLIDSRKNHVSLQGLGDFADRLPADVAFTMRSMHLVAMLHRSLDGLSADRFWKYTVTAAEGAWLDPSSDLTQDHFNLLRPVFALCGRAARFFFMMRLGAKEGLQRTSRLVDGLDVTSAQQFSLGQALTEHVDTSGRSRG